MKTMRNPLRLLVGLILVLPQMRGGVVTADTVTDWNMVMQNTVAVSNPFLQARDAAIVQLAVFEAVNAVLGDYESYLGMPLAPGASPEAAVVGAAHRTLMALYPAAHPLLDLARMASLSAIPAGMAREAGLAVGEDAAEAVLELRAEDGTDAVTTYTPGTAPGEWQPTPPGFSPAILAGWGQVATFGIESGAAFRATPPPGLQTGVYARDWHEVREVGESTDAKRAPDRTDVALFYRTAAVQVYNPAARQVSEAQGKTLSENARIFALLAMAICDGLISSMESKYHYGYWRPVTAIHFGDMDGNHKTGAVPGWVPLVVTPPFPSYPSAHASAGGAARVVLKHSYGRTGHSITLISATAPGVVLSYTSWKQITDDVDDARVYGGIHFRFDQEAGIRQGSRIGSFILRNHLKPRR